MGQRRSEKVRNWQTKATQNLLFLFGRAAKFFGIG
jgi:hypothetical protein